MHVVDRTRDEWCMPYENDLPSIVGRGPKYTLQEVWPRGKMFI